MATAPTIRRIEIAELSSHLATLEEELEQAGSIELAREGTVVAELTAKQPVPAVPANGERYFPDFRARWKEIFGDRILDTDGAAIIREDRDARG